MSLPDDAPCPRLCHLIKWPDFNGYGFNLHAEKTKHGQYIGKVDDDSPAMLAGLREGDKIVEVNFVNICNENHRQVVERIKSITNETRLLVIDDYGDRWYRERKIVIKSSQPNVIYYRTPVPRPEPGTQPIPASPESLLNRLNNNNTSNKPTIDDQQSNQEHNANGDSSNRTSSSLSNGNNIDINQNKNFTSNNKTNITDSPISTHSSASTSHSNNENNIEEKTTTTTDNKINSVATNGTDTSNKTLNTDGGELNLNMTAAEMRQLIAQRKKKDVKKTNIDLRKKYEIIQQM